MTPQCTESLMKKVIFFNVFIIKYLYQITSIKGNIITTKCNFFLHTSIISSMFVSA